MTPLLEITILLFLALLATSFLYWKEKQDSQRWIKAHSKLQSKSFFKSNDYENQIKGQQNTIDTLNFNLNKLIKDKLKLDSELSELRQFAQDQHEAFVRLSEIYKGLDGSEPKQLRSVESLTTDDAIVCNDEKELNAVLKKFEEAGKVWAFDGDKPTKWKPQDGWAFPECISMNRHLREIYRSSIYRRNRIPASDFVQI